MMSDKLEWTERLGNAVLEDQARVMDTVQGLLKTRGGGREFEVHFRATGRAREGIDHHRAVAEGSRVRALLRFDRRCTARMRPRTTTITTATTAPPQSAFRTAVRTRSRAASGAWQHDAAHRRGVDYPHPAIQAPPGGARRAAGDVPRGLPLDPRRRAQRRPSPIHACRGARRSRAGGPPSFGNFGGGPLRMPGPPPGVKAALGASAAGEPAGPSAASARRYVPATRRPRRLR